MRRRIAIVGGGISGLTAAYALTRDHAHTCEVTLYEASDRLGGIVETVREGGFTVECGPDSWVTEKPWAAALARELGLGGELLHSNDRRRRTYIAQDHTLAALPDGMRMMVPTDLDALDRSLLFSAGAKQAYRAEPIRAAKLRTAALAARGADADESVAAFVERHFGLEVTATVAGPLLAGVFGGDIHQLSARALLAPFVAMEQEHGSLVAALKQREPASAGSVFTTLESGLGTLVDRLHGALPAACVQLNAPILSIEPARHGWTLRTRLERQRYDALLLATPLDTTRKFLRDMPLHPAREAAACLPADASSSLIVALGYTGAAAGSLSLPEGFGLLVADGSHSLLACTFMHQKFAHRVPPGGVLLRAFFGNAAADAWSAESDAAVIDEARTQLIRLLGALPAQVDLALVRRWPRSLPQYAVGHLPRMRHFHACLSALPNLAVAGNFDRGVGLPDLIRDATAAAHRLAQR
jgi:protoporphyrinogen/coproporphyrinogen III oxidase